MEKVCVIIENSAGHLLLREHRGTYIFPESEKSNTPDVSLFVRKLVKNYSPAFTLKKEQTFETGNGRDHFVLAEVPAIGLNEQKGDRWLHPAEVLVNTLPEYRDIYQRVLLEFGVVAYRRGVVGIVQYGMTDFLLCQNRLNLADWKFPAGGVEKNEKEEETLLRELEEEIGTRAHTIKILKTSAKRLSYLWPSEVIARSPAKKFYIGQEQRYFLVEVFDKTIRLDQYEFIDHSWCTLAQVFEKTLPSRRKNYEEALREFGLVQ